VVIVLVGCAVLRGELSHGMAGLEGGLRIPDWAEFAEEVEEFFGADGVAEVLDKERSVGVLVGYSVQQRMAEGLR
jgi:hypothetical protein